MGLSSFLLLTSVFQFSYFADALFVHDHPVRNLDGTGFKNLTASSHNGLSDVSSSDVSTTEIIQALTSHYLPAIPISSLATTGVRKTAPSNPDSTQHEFASETQPRSSSQALQTRISRRPTNTSSAHITKSPVHPVPIPTNGSCHSYCNYLGARQSTLVWTPACLVTLGAHTIIHVVNNRTNTTQTITKSIDLSGIDELGIVSLGDTSTRAMATQTTVTLSRGLSNAVTTIVDYPNTIVEYPSVYSLQGVGFDAILNDIHTNTTCAETLSTVTFPSHPPLPTEATVEITGETQLDSPDEDSTAAAMVACRNVVIGDLTIRPSSVTTTTVVPVWRTGDVPIDFYRSAFPNDKAFHRCKGSTGREVLGKITFVQAVQFLTETSTSYATGLEPIRTVEDPDTQTTTTTTANPGHSPASAAKSQLSIDGPNTASRIEVLPAGPSATSTQALHITIGGSVLPIIPGTLTTISNDGASPVASPAVVIGTQTVALGSEAAVTIDGIPVAVHTSDGFTFAIVGDTAHASTVQLYPAPSDPTITPPPIVVGGITVPPSLRTDEPPLVISGQTLLPGHAVILAGDNREIVALATDPAGVSVLVAGGKTTTLASGLQPVPLVLAGHTFAPASLLSGYIVSGQILTLGGFATIQDGVSIKTLALTTNLRGQTVLIHDGRTETISSSTEPPLIVDGLTLSLISSSARFEYHVSGKTLTMGGTITIGTALSQTILAFLTNSAGQTILVENGKTKTLLPTAISTTSTKGAPSTVGIADLIGSVMGLSRTAAKTSSSPNVSFSLGSATGTPTPSSNGSACLFISRRRMLGVWMIVLGFLYQL